MISVQILNWPKTGFCKKLLLYECNSDQLPISFIKIWFSCNQHIGETLFLHWVSVSPICWLQENLILMKKIHNEVTSYKIQSLVHFSIVFVLKHSEFMILSAFRVIYRIKFLTFYPCIIFFLTYQKKYWSGWVPWFIFF